MGKTTFIMIGAAILDVLAKPVNLSAFRVDSIPAETLTTNTGGDAMNEARTLAALGAKVRLVSKLGEDAAGEMILGRCRDLGIDTEFIRRSAEIPTGVNIVLIDEAGEWRFITNPHGTLRQFYPEDIPREALEGGKILCFASIFVAPAFTAPVLAELFSQAKQKGLLLCADMTKRKNQETVWDMRECLQWLDYIFPNYEEASLLTGRSDWDEIADAFLECGVGHVVIKAGARGCFIKSRTERLWVPACRGVRCVDTTGAGDTFSACFLYALDQGYSLEDCGRFANAGASFCIQQVGAVGAGNDPEAVRKRAGLQGTEPTCV